MATNRCLNRLTRHSPCLFFPSSSNAPIQTTITKSPLHTLSATSDFNLPSLGNPNNTTNPPHLHHKFGSLFCIDSCFRHFSSQRRYPNGKQGDEEDEGEDSEDEDDDEEEGELSEDSDEEENRNDVSVSNHVVNRTYSLEEKEQEADVIGYKVIGPLDPSERPFKHREPFFAVVQIGSHQFKVSNGDVIYTERLKFCEVNDKLTLSKVLMVGSQNQTIIGRPILPDTEVHAVVEEHALDAKVIIFKKKRRKNYRRTKGHRQELTRLRITDIQGIEKLVKPEKPEKPGKRERVKLEREKLEREAVAA